MTNNEFQKLMEMNKHFEKSEIFLPVAGEKSISFKILSDTTKDIFYLDTDRKSSISLTKKKLQERHKNTNIIMIRLEIDCRPHMFADGSFSSRNHIHIFDEKLGNITYDLSNGFDKIFHDINDFNAVFQDFCKYCNIRTDTVNIQGVL